VLGKRMATWCSIGLLFRFSSAAMKTRFIAAKAFVRAQFL
jgi:hypothetical protein